MIAVCWLTGGLVAACAHRGDETLARDRGRMLGLIAGALLAHLGWVAVHGPQIVAVAGAGGLLLWSLDLASGASMLFVPLGSVVVRALRRDDERLIDADVRALVPGLAVARLGCVVEGCCGGHAMPIATASFAGLVLLAWLTRRPGGGPLALAGIGGLRLGLEPLRAPPPHGGETAWVFAIALGWLVAGCVWGARARRASTAGGAQKSSPSSKPSRTGPVELPRPTAPTPPVARCCWAMRSFGVPSFSMRPRGGGVRRRRKTPRLWPSRS